MNKADKIETLKMQKEPFNARIQKLESAEKTRDKKRDTRREILVGAYYLDKIKEEGGF